MLKLKPVIESRARSRSRISFSTSPVLEAVLNWYSKVTFECIGYTITCKTCYKYSWRCYINKNCVYAKYLPSTTQFSPPVIFDSRCLDLSAAKKEHLVEVSSFIRESLHSPHRSSLLSSGPYLYLCQCYIQASRSR